MELKIGSAFLLTWLWIGVAIASGQAPDDELSAFGFETLPADLNLAGTHITLASDTLVEGNLQANGEINSTVGIRYPDGSLQTTSAMPSALLALTANDGLYSNQIVEITPPFDYTEVCFVGGQILIDLHPGGESTVGGATQNCNPGDVGWVIEQNERDSGSTVHWTQARLGCLLDGMRLAEPFEWQVSCDQRVEFDLAGMTQGPEWASNHVGESSLSSDVGFGVAVFGETPNGSGCQFAGVGFLGRVSGTRNQHQYRCVR